MVAAACALLLLAVTSGRLSRLILGNTVLRWAGKLSYGFYVFHRLGAHIANRTVAWNHAAGTPGYSWDAALYVAVEFAATIAICTVSYYAYERYFLRLKKRYTVIASREP